MTVEEATTEQQQQFQTAVTNGLSAARTAVEEDPSNVINWLLLARMYTTLAQVGIEGAAAEASTAYDTAESLAPQNPEIPLLRAQLATSIGELATARAEIAAALELKSNYSDALFLLAQIEISEGITVAALEAAESSLILAPRDAARAYQVGLLQLSDQRLEAAVLSFERAIAIDPNFANARYYLALVA